MRYTYHGIDLHATLTRHREQALTDTDAHSQFPTQSQPWPQQPYTPLAPSAGLQHLHRGAITPQSISAPPVTLTSLILHDYEPCHRLPRKSLRVRDSTHTRLDKRRSHSPRYTQSRHVHGPAPSPLRRPKP
ncbi:hypothetical protein BDZ89DRAFT_396523 [Hymenopellis radicata]|nr:hypothetical protein BDZ89DRAFT_396523 [Hymenopellis radicata]